MDSWIWYVLGALVAIAAIAGVLYLLGMKDLAKKIVLPLTLLAGAFIAVTKVFGSTGSIKRENERIKRELAENRKKHEELKDEIATETDAFERDADALRDDIRTSDERAETLQEKVDRLKASGAADWFAQLTPEEQQRIRARADAPNLPDEFLNT